MIKHTLKISIAVLILFTLNECRAASIVKKQVVEKTEKNFTSRYENILNKLRRDSFLKDEFESQAEYESRVSKIKFDDKLSFEEYIEINFKYNPEENVLYFNNEKNDFYAPVTNVLMFNRFENCSKSENILVKITNKKNISLTGCKEEGYGHSIYNEKNGFIKTIDIKSKKYEAVNGFGNKVIVTDYDIDKIFICPIDDSLFEKILQIKIPSNKQYAKANLSMRLKLNGFVIKPSQIKTAVIYNKATFDNPTEMTLNYIAAIVDIEKASLVDNQGNEIKIDFSAEKQKYNEIKKLEEEKAQKNNTNGVITDGNECERQRKNWIWNGSINQWKCI